MQWYAASAPDAADSPNPELSGTLAKVAMVLGGVLATFGVFTLTLAAVLGPLAVVRFSLMTLGVQGGLLRGVLGGLGSGLRIVSQALLFVARLAMAHPVIALIGALAMGALYVWRNWDSLGPRFAALWKRLVEGFDGIKTKFQEIGANLIAGLVGGITRSLGLVKEAIGGAASATVGWFKEKLGIHSPSRVFAALGGFVGQGAALGIDGERMRIAKAATGLATIAAAAFGAPGGALGAPNGALRGPGIPGSPGLVQTAALARNTPTVLVRPSIPIDTRAALGTGAALASAQAGNGAPSYVTIHVHPPAGADAAAIARQVRAEWQRVERERQSRIGARLSD